MFGTFGVGELLVLAVLGLVIFGPDRLPTVLRDARTAIRQVMALARSAKDDLQAELGPEMADLDLASLHPRRLVQDALFGDDEPLLTDRDRDRGKAPVAGAGRLAPQVPLAPGERPPYDADAT